MNFTNNSLRENQTTQEYSLGLTSNYAVVKADPEECVLSNNTSSIDQPELVSFRFRRIPTVNSNLNIQYPAKVLKGVQYAVEIQEVIRETSTSADGCCTIVVDHPVVMYLTIRHELSGAITPTILATIFERLLSALRRESDNSYRFDDLMRDALKPYVS